MVISGTTYCTHNAPHCKALICSLFGSKVYHQLSSQKKHTVEPGFKNRQDNNLLNFKNQITNYILLTFGIKNFFC